MTECPECGGALRKVYGAVGIVLKGSGFYKTDSRAAAGGSGNGNGERQRDEQGQRTSRQGVLRASSSIVRLVEQGLEGQLVEERQSDGEVASGGSKDSKPAAAAAS